MKRLFSISKTMRVIVFSIFISALTLAQDVISEVDLDINITAIDEGPFYAQLWFWVVLGLVFLLLLIGLIRGSGRKKVVEEKEKETIEKGLL